MAKEKPQKFKDLDELVASTISATLMASASIATYINDVPYLPFVFGGMTIWSAIDATRCYHRTRNRI